MEAHFFRTSHDLRVAHTKKDKPNVGSKDRDGSVYTDEWYCCKLFHQAHTALQLCQQENMHYDWQMKCLLLVSCCCMFDLMSFVHHKGMSAMSSVRSDEWCVESHIFSVSSTIVFPYLQGQDFKAQPRQKSLSDFGAFLQMMWSCSPRRSMTLSFHWKDSQMSVKQLGWRWRPRNLRLWFSARNWLLTLGGGGVVL